MECFKFYFSLCISSSFFVIVVVIVKVEFAVESVLHHVVHVFGM